MPGSTRGPAKKPLSGPGQKFALLSAQGADRADILQEIFGIDVRTADREAINRADVQMSRWRRHKDFDTIFTEEVKRILRGTAGKAIRVLKMQMDKDNVPWLQNKAANDILTQSKQALFGDEEKTINVKIEGMPELGEPDQDGASQDGSQADSQTEDV